MPDAPARRKPGPQATAARNDRAVIEAAREVFLTQGFDAPVSAVAERAGVGMGSLYRRYRTKEELLQRLCVDSMERLADAARAALRAPDPWEGLAGYVRRCAGFGFGALAPLAGTIASTEDMWRAARAAQELAEAVVARAHAAGVLRRDVTALDVSLLIGKFSTRATAPSPAEEENAAHRILAIALDGLRAGHPEPLPGHPPVVRRYEDLWRRGGGQEPPSA
ncbi:TetR/AcrR family transcriptional regulator [Streptomyces sp. MP131-18]|uniref:TetR/AcrR family transcriptional regulator n=1 Tax=Streptomyces sp. MP131-18 TaxID=1857892 RepID=UPI0009A2025E|nr:TetR/AcrR family transcriptional regulator [Streptomyces sp. MP131-18]ONK13655.1 Bacterial regulatory protein, tetR family [Streptomyces sp. MP131-18]